MTGSVMGTYDFNSWTVKVHACLGHTYEIAEVLAAHFITPRNSFFEMLREDS